MLTGKKLCVELHTSGKMFHLHNWYEVRRYFVPPASVAGLKARGVEGVDLFRDLANGYTVIELKCETCGDIKAKHLMGDATRD
jgi:hypothetical protein